ncbi:hypothetical protein BDZ89DRAFT_352563 [Hymenopellis radicata]|nr:hypothetical protein BDZ89DRAFT_352563 [Hymenopellis radicata]
MRIWLEHHCLCHNLLLDMPETMHRTLEELDYTYICRAHQGRTCLLWFIKRYVIRQKNAVLELLYHLEAVESITVRRVLDTKLVLDPMMSDKSTSHALSDRLPPSCRLALSA